jgi:hypothetical protein
MTRCAIRVIRCDAKNGGPFAITLATSLGYLEMKEAAN